MFVLSRIDVIGRSRHTTDAATRCLGAERKEPCCTEKCDFLCYLFFFFLSYGLSNASSNNVQVEDCDIINLVRWQRKSNDEQHNRDLYH